MEHLQSTNEKSGENHPRQINFDINECKKEDFTNNEDFSSITDKLAQWKSKRRAPNKESTESNANQKQFEDSTSYSGDDPETETLELKDCTISEQIGIPRSSRISDEASPDTDDYGSSDLRELHGHSLEDNNNDTKHRRKYTFSDSETEGFDELLSLTCMDKVDEKFENLIRKYPELSTESDQEQEYASSCNSDHEELLNQSDCNLDPSGHQHSSEQNDSGSSTCCEAQEKKLLGENLEKSEPHEHQHSQNSKNTVNENYFSDSHQQKDIDSLSSELSEEFEVPQEKQLSEEIEKSELQKHHFQDSNNTVDENYFSGSQQKDDNCSRLEETCLKLNVLIHPDNSGLNACKIVVEKDDEFISTPTPPCTPLSESPRSLSKTRDNDWQSNSEEPLEQPLVVETNSDDQNNVSRQETTQVQETEGGYFEEQEIKEIEVGDTAVRTTETAVTDESLDQSRYGDDEKTASTQCTSTEENKMFTTTPHDNLTVPTKSEGNLKGDPETTVAVEEPVDIMEEIRHETVINPTNSNTAQKSFETEKKDNIIYVSPKLTGNDSLEQDYSPRMQEAPWQQEWIATSAKRKAALAQKQQQRTQQEENERCDQSGVLHLETNRVELQNGKVSNTGNTISTPPVTSVRTIINFYDKPSKPTYIPGKVCETGRKFDYEVFYYNLFQDIMDPPFYAMVVYAIIKFLVEILTFIFNENL